MKRTELFGGTLIKIETEKGEEQVKYPGLSERLFCPSNVSFILCLFVYELMSHGVLVVRGQPEIHSYYHTGPEDQSHVIKLAGWCSCLLSHLTSHGRGAEGGNEQLLSP